MCGRGRVSDVTKVSMSEDMRMKGDAILWDVCALNCESPLATILRVITEFLEPTTSTAFHATMHD